MNTTQTFPLRLTRGTTGTVHAGRELEKPVLDFSLPHPYRTGATKLVTEKACGYDPNTMRRVTGMGQDDAATEVTCKKCIKVLAA